MKNKGIVMVLALILSALFSAQAYAGVVLNKKVAHFKSPFEMQTVCAKWAYPWPGSKICIGHAYRFLTHEYHMRVEGP